MDRRLYEAALTGNVGFLNELLQEDGDIVDKVFAGDAPKETPLHIAAQFGHVNFVKEIINRKPQFTSKLNSQEQSPLHLASAAGHKEVAQELLRKDADACYIRDREGRTPLHIAAMKGHVQVLEALVNATKFAKLIKTHRDETLLHLCAKHDHFEAAKMLIKMAISDEESEKTKSNEENVFICEKDDEDNTVLHLLAAKKRYKIIELLFPKEKNIFNLDVNAINTNGFTALDLLGEIPRGPKGFKITMILRGAEAKRARELPKTTRNRLRKSSYLERSRDWTNKSRDALMVVAILLTTITYQAALNPPGGVLSEDKNINGTIYIAGQSITYEATNVTTYKAGQSIMSMNFYKKYIVFMISNTVGFVHSIVLILLLLSGLSFESKILMRTMIAFTWISVLSLLVSYGCSFSSLATHHGKHLIFLTGVFILGFGWLATITLLFILLFPILKKPFYKIESICYFFWAKFKIKDVVGWILKFRSNMCSSKEKNKNALAC